MKQIATVLVIIAASIYIGQWLYGFQEAASKRAADKQARFEQIVRENVAEAARKP